MKSVLILYPSWLLIKELRWDLIQIFIHRIYCNITSPSHFFSLFSICFLCIVSLQSTFLSLTENQTVRKLVITESSKERQS